MNWKEYEEYKKCYEMIPNPKCYETKMRQLAEVLEIQTEEILYERVTK